MNWSSDENIKITFRLLNIKGFGPVQTNKILYSLKYVVDSSSQLEESISNLLADEQLSYFKRPYELFQKDGMVRYVSMLDSEVYPLMLIDMLSQNSPTVLSYMGNLNLLKKRRVGFSGSRKVSEKGLWITKDIVSQLGEEDICIVSGYANGVDAMAHRTALESGATTIIVLPEGISNFYVRSALKDVWDWDRVLVVSEFLPHEKWMASKAMKRNSTIIALSDAMIVVEAGETGGSLDAGMKTLRVRKPLFVPRFKEPTSSNAGNNILLANSASPLGFDSISNHTNLSGLRESLSFSNCSAGIFNIP